jgi:hypothetical protein
VMLFSKRVNLLLEIDEGADTLRFNDRCGRSFARYQRGFFRLANRCIRQVALASRLTRSGAQMCLGNSPAGNRGQGATASLATAAIVAI